MIQKPMQADPYQFEWATNRSKDYIDSAIKRAEEIKTDSRKDERIAKGECLACFYVIGKSGGAAMTNRECALCGKNQLYESTCTDALCIDCARENNLCKHCGGDVDLKIRRKKWPTKSELKAI